MMTTLPAVVPAEARSAERTATPVVVPAVAATGAGPAAGFADALLAVSGIPALPPSPTQGEESPAATASSEQPGDSQPGQDELAMPTPVPQPMALPLVLPVPPTALFSANLGSLPGMAGGQGGTVSTNQEAPSSPLTMPAMSSGVTLLAPAASPAGESLIRPAASDDGSLPLATSGAGSNLPAWLGQALPAEPRAALPEWAPLTLPAGQPARWGESLRAALGERMAVQSSHGMDRALIRLDPPSFGSLEIAIRHEAGTLTVQLVASHGEVVRQLQAIGDALRQDLSARQYTQVAVEVREGAPGGSQGQGRSGRETPQDGRTPGRALAEAGSDGAGPFALAQG